MRGSREDGPLSTSSSVLGKMQYRNTFPYYLVLTFQAEIGQGDRKMYLDTVFCPVLVLRPAPLCSFLQPELPEMEETPGYDGTF